MAGMHTGLVGSLESVDFALMTTLSFVIAVRPRSATQPLDEAHIPRCIRLCRRAEAAERGIGLEEGTAPRPGSCSRVFAEFGMSGFPAGHTRLLGPLSAKTLSKSEDGEGLCRGKRSGQGFFY